MSQPASSSNTHVMREDAMARFSSLPDILAYTQRSTVPTIYQWCPVGGLVPTDALKVVDAFIKCHFYHLDKNDLGTLGYQKRRKAAIILGVTRAVMTAEYNLAPDSLIGDQTGGTYINVQKNSEGVYDYILTEPDAPLGSWSCLTEPLDLTETEKAAVKLLMKLGLTIIPIQGHNLLADDHHYLVAPQKQSARACHAIERQVVVDPIVKTWFDFGDGFSRDVLWHKAGHPVTLSVKYAAATSHKVKTNLLAMDLASAAMRLPAVESVARPISTYLKLTNEVKGVWEAHGGGLDNRIFQEVLDALDQFPIGATSVPIANAPGEILRVYIGSFLAPERRTEVTNREMVLDFIKQLLPKVQEKVAFVFGFYMGMVEDGQMMGDKLRFEYLSRAYCLTKLRSKCMASYISGREAFADYLAMKRKTRLEGRLCP